LRTTLNNIITLVNELATDHATQKTSHDAVETLIEEMYDDEEAKRNYLDFINEADGVVGGDFTISAGAATTLTGAGHVAYKVNGEWFYCALDTTITLADDGDVDDTKWRAWRIEIDRAGTVTAVADGDTQHANEEDAMLNLGGLARTANTATIGYFSIHSNGGFNIGTDNVNGETAANVYHVRGPAKQVSGLHTALGASIAVGSSDTNFSHGTVDGKINGQYKTQIAPGADVAFDDADTITTSGEFGGHLVLIGLDGASIYAVSADGGAGTATAMTYADAAAANTAIDTLVDRLPEVFCPIGRIVVEAAKNSFTYGTDDIAGTDGTATYTDATVGSWERSTITGFDSHKINPPAIPAVLTAGKPASGPATLTASSVTTTINA
jgi:hypothetical protein